MGLSIESGGKGRRRSLDTEVNLVPMIDFLIVTISFLVLTAVWTSSGRLDASAQTGGRGEVCEDCAPRKLVLDARGADKFVLTWKEGEKVLRTSEIPKREVTETHGKLRRVRYPELQTALSAEWATYGLHRDSADRKVDPLVLRTSNELPYASLVGLMDASSSVRRPLGPSAPGDTAAFDVTFAVD